MTSTAFRAMGTNVYMEIPDADVSDCVQSEILETAVDEMAKLESLLTRFIADSELNRLNNSAGRWTDIDPHLYKILQLAKDFFVKTRGLFNPCLGTIMNGLGYDVSFEHITTNKNNPIFEIPYVAQMHCPFNLRMNENKCQAFLEPGHRIDLGGIAKGWIVQQVAAKMRSLGAKQFVCNAGGDLICSGCNGRRPWVIGITDPFDPKRNIILLDIRNLSIATSGTYKRTWNNQGKVVHHIIDPFLGTPVESDIVSCSVVHKDLVTAEVQAKVALLMGTDTAVPWLERQDCAGWVLVKQNRLVVKSCNLSTNNNVSHSSIRV
ncbi:FAD:protein FMN transferase [Alicyclobacillus fastidiosus]|uniref:FAD:protein FMN transferase n=1 Tax=Alicyclobacillus fastidiosus TaxID=392011 RepID=A0ABY6ZEL3_9BACL|nr:FAD:protein FMN transferase [Alicyclobacillus fastidiosus]WAH41263.1 FAD:protein FMN transferase [Alicyclobacillus fastidiosus]GMA62857.1 FAD:protein FMN transferase [Alicyclobacillus fastidiosus]